MLRHTVADTQPTLTTAYMKFFEVYARQSGTGWYIGTVGQSNTVSCVRRL